MPSSIATEIGWINSTARASSVTIALHCDAGMITSIANQDHVSIMVIYVNRPKQTQKENRQTSKGSKSEDIQIPTSGTIRKLFNKYSNKSSTEKSNPRKVLSRPSKDSNTTNSNGINRNGQVVYKPGLKQDRTTLYRRKSVQVSQVCRVY